MAAYGGEHSFEEISIELIKRNMEMMSTLGRVAYDYATNQDNIMVTHTDLMKNVPAYSEAMSVEVKKKIIEKF